MPIASIGSINLCSIFPHNGQNDHHRACYATGKRNSQDFDASW